MDLQTAELLGDCCRFAQTGWLRDRPAGVIAEQAISGAFAHAGDAVWLSFADRQVLAFQGTMCNYSVETFFDWIYHFRAKAVPALDLPGVVHSGFAALLRPILDAILKKLNDAGDSQPLFLTGFSHGGALALLTAAVLKQKSIACKATYVFGSPRVGDADFAASLKTPVYRFEYGRDLVPHVPFKKPDSVLCRIAWEELKDRLPAKIEKLFDTAEDEYAVYEHAGELCYRASGDEAWKSYSAAEERRLRSRRAIKLLSAGRRICYDHELGRYPYSRKTAASAAMLNFPAQTTRC
jgi:hypothetical protein